MKINIFYIFIFEFIKITYSIVPVWNLKKTGIDLFEKHGIGSEINIYTINTAIHDDFHFYFNIKLTKVGNNVKIQKSLGLESESYVIENAPWEDIESSYTNKKDKFYFCPKGKYHAYVYYKNNRTYESLMPKDFVDNGNWELKCYYQNNLGYIFVSYLNSDKPLYQLEVSSGNFVYNKQIEQGIYDYKWTTDPNNNKYAMIAILKKNNQIYLKDLDFKINKNFTYEEKKEKKIIENLKSNYNIFFNNNNYNFYWINYNNISDFTSGLYFDGAINANNIESIETNINDNSPLEFLDDVTIKKMNFIPYTKYVYYEIYNNIKKITYHGIIDILLNKVIFNTDEEIKIFIPISKYSMLAVTKDSAYEICAIYDGSFNCIESCYNTYNSRIIYDTQKPNQCYEKYNCENYILMPNEVCIETCDENIFTVIDDNNNKQCGLCRDINKNNPYKLINTKKCFSTPPEGTKIIDEKLKLINCSDGYSLKNDTCIIDKCNSHCKTCKGYSEDDNNQNCISCNNENDVLYKGNCINDCPNGYYKKDKECNECDKSCSSCSESPNYCTSCINGKYLNESLQTCLKCSVYCETCTKFEESESQNCLSCKKNSKYKYLFNNNCVEKCPNNTSLKNDECIVENNSKYILLWIIIILITFLLIIISFCIYRKFSYKLKSQKDLVLVEKINTELGEKEMFES